MNPELPKNPREEMELRVTALLLGELTADEAAAVREAIAKDSELAKLHDDLKATIQLVQSAATKEVESTNVETAQPRLSEARRKKLLTAFVIPPLKSKDRKPKPVFRLGLVELAAVLAILVVLAAMFLPALQVAKSRSQLARSGLEPESLSRRSWLSEGRTTPTPDLAGQPQSANGVVTATESAVSRYAADSALERVQAEILAQTLSDDAGEDVTVSGRPEVMFSNSLKPEQRRLATAESLPAASPVASAKPRAAIVLPSLAEADADKPAAGALVQQTPETTLAFSVREPQSVVAGDVIAGDRFYRFSGGGAGGGGVGGAAAQSGAATPANLGSELSVAQLPTLGKTFRESESLKHDGAVLADNFAASDFTAVPDSGVAKPQAWYDASHTKASVAGDKVDPSTGLPSLKLQEELQLGRAVVPSGIVAMEPAMRGAGVAGSEVAQDKSRGDSLDVTAGQFGAFAPQAQSLEFREAGSTPPAQQPAAAAGSTLLGVATPAPSTPAVAEAEEALMERYGIASGEVKKGVAVQPTDPARQLNESLASGLRGSGGERGRQLVQEGRLLLEAGKPIEAEAKLESALESNPGDNAARYYLNFAREAQRRAASRAGSGAKDALIATGFGRETAPRSELEKQIVLKRNEVEVMRRQREVFDLDAEGMASTPSLEAEALRRYHAESIAAQAQLTALQVTVDKLKQLNPEELKQALPRVRPDPVLNDQLSQLNQSEQQLMALRKDSAPGQPEYQQAQKQVEDLRKQVDQSAAEIVSALEKQVESQKAGVAKLQEMVDNAKQADIEIAQKSRPYYEKKRELDQLRMSERILGTKLAAQGIDHTIPQSSMVEIVDKAQPAPAKKPSLLARLTGNTDSEAVARITIDRDVTDIEGVRGSRTATAYDPYFVQTQFEVMQSDVVLGEVVGSLALDQAWAKNGQRLKPAEAVALLKQKLDVKPVKNSSLVEIRAKDEDPDEAAKIANAVAEAYRDYRMQERSRLSQGGIEVLEERYQEQLAKIIKAEAEVEALRQRLNISDTDAAGNAPVASVKVEVDTPLPRKLSTNAPIPQPEIQVSENAFSTFSLNVSDVSFKLAMASLEKGQMPDAASVRSEEFINAFDYRDPEPAAGSPVAFAWERARYPFAHNRDLLRFSLKTAAAGRQAGRPLNVVLLLDNSGSMERADRVHIIREALAVLATQLQPQDKLSVITFARTPRLVADGVSGDKAGELAEQVSGLTPQGGTNLEDAMNLAYQTAGRHYLASGINRVVLLTDGAANLGNVEPESLKQKVEAQRKQGIALDAFGIGWEGFNDDLLEVLSRNGDGRYGFINSPEEAATDFVGQLAGALKVAASDVKVQVEFNPKRVTAYRQIGYAKHQLTKEQFRDNTVDAAEIAAQEAGNALYTVEVNPAGGGPLGTVRVRYKIPGTTDYREQAWDVPFAGNAAPLEHSSATMRLAASASAFSEWLVASPFAGEVTPDRLLGYLGGVPEIYGVDARPKKLEWMIRQAKSLEGK